MYKPIQHQTENPEHIDFNLGSSKYKRLHQSPKEPESNFLAESDSIIIEAPELFCNFFTI